MLHLQCHFGLDTLSWAREGAVVTGVDFSPEAIDLARSISDERIAHPYFHAPEPTRYQAEGSYAAPDAAYPGASYEWAHPLGDVVTALLSAGLALDFLSCKYPRR